jgi:arylsulfatase A
MKTTLIATTLGLAALKFVPTLHAQEAAAPQKPNIILILADDLGIGNFGAYGADNFKTPNLDALAKSGMRFEQCYSSPVCGPSRAMLLTGRYGFNTGMTGNDKQSQKLMEAGKDSEVMIGKLLKSAGYTTTSIGKWSQVPLDPMDWGFSESLKQKGSGNYWNVTGDGIYWVNKEEKPWGQEEYLPDTQQKAALDFINRHQDKPFFLYYPINFAHTDIQRTPDSAADSKDLFTDNITYMDKQIGQLVAELDRLKLRDKTLIMFTGDNGTHPGEAPRATIGGKALSGAKGSLLEGGSRVPLIASWPGTIAADTKCDDLISFADFYPTLAQLAGAKLPEGLAIDGVSFAPQLRGAAGTPREWVFVMLGHSWYVREQGWKLNEKGELFDMKGAPFEEKPVAADSTDPEALAARTRLQAVLAKLNPTGGKLGDPSGKSDKRSGKEKDKKKDKEKKNKEGEDAPE